uniref:Lipoprotein n=1 Tax=Kofleria flava TaxID=694315 RepID=A0A3S5GXM3_9BACT|nr:hypothetical protein [Kofleria flava]
MFREPHRSSPVALGAILLTGLALSGCGGDDSDGPPDPPDSVTQPASVKARVKRKSPALLASDLGQALDLPRAEICAELGSHDCFDTHEILLGGVEPYKLRIDEPLAVPSVASPMAVDRIVLTACGERATRDFDAPAEAVLFAEVAAAGAPDAAARAAVTGRLYERLLARPASAQEIDDLVGFYDELGASAQPGRDWAQLACYAVATTTEFLFY